MSTQILQGDCRDLLKTLPDASVHCVVTSPPYFGLRDYGVDGQIGLEASPEAFVAEMVAVFREVRRVLRDDGTLWLNLGDSYGATGGDTHSGFNERYSGTGGAGSKQDATLNGIKDHKTSTGLRPKNLLGIPWRVAFALQQDGWYLRQDIIWHKPNPMPESVTDRCTKSHEYVFLMSKSARYFYDAAAIAEEGVIPAGTKAAKGSVERFNTLGVNSRPPEYKIYNGMRNARSVWTIATQPFREAHFATFPPDLAERCIKAGCPVGGTVLDPFGGAGTTGLVADRLQRSSILIELNPVYASMAKKRLEGDAPLFAKVGT
jgi:DNA modification methylase